MAPDAQEPVRESTAAGVGGHLPSRPAPSAQPLHIEAAQKVAQALRSELGPACDRIEIAGSVRRQKAIVRDLELVAISRTTVHFETVDLFTSRRCENLDVWDALEALRLDGRLLPISPRSSEPEEDPNWQSKRSGSRYLKLFLIKPRLKVDLFLVDPPTWGLLYTIRTGSAEFSKRLVTHWTQLSGGRAREGRLYLPEAIGGKPVATPEEADVFRACRLLQPAPPERIDALTAEPPLACHHRAFHLGCAACESWAEIAWGMA